MAMQENENISYAELSRADYITAVQQSSNIETSELMEMAKSENHGTLGPAVVAKMRQNARTACRLFLQMESEGTADRKSMEECLQLMPAPLMRFMEAYYGKGEAGSDEMQACRFLREVFLACSRPHQLKRYAKLVHSFPEILPETAEIFLKEGHYVLAMEMYQDVPDDKISELDKCHAIGTCAYYSGKFDIASENLKRAMELGDDSPELPIFLQWIEESEAKHR